MNRRNIFKSILGFFGVGSVAFATKSSNTNSCMQLESFKKNGEPYVDSNGNVYNTFRKGDENYYTLNGEVYLTCDKSGKKYWKNGLLHRDDDLPAIDNTHGGTKKGDQHWYQNGLNHRDNGPASIWSDGTEQWRKHGKLHRDDGPAITYDSQNKKWAEWYENGEFIKLREIVS
ncbi:MAG: hypothetical protein WCG45_05595 [bacterium]